MRWNFLFTWTTMNSSRQTQQYEVTHLFSQSVSQLLAYVLRMIFLIVDKHIFIKWTGLSRLRVGSSDGFCNIFYTPSNLQNTKEIIKSVYTTKHLFKKKFTVWRNTLHLCGFGDLCSVSPFRFSNLEPVQTNTAQVRSMYTSRMA
jgi:hypothetical protein